jgi:16S rRNA C1402 N4-methylase RsmH
MELRQIFEKYTDLKESKYIAEVIFAKKPINTTFELRDAVVGCFQKDKQKKLAQVFQAFRIATNNELEDMEKLCDSV